MSGVEEVVRRLEQAKALIEELGKALKPTGRFVVKDAPIQ